MSKETLLGQTSIDALTLAYMAKAQTKVLIESLLYSQVLAVECTGSLSRDDWFYALSAIQSNLEGLATILEADETKEVLCQIRFKTPDSPAQESKTP